MEDAARLRAAIGELCSIDPSFGGIEAAAGPLAFRRRPPGFATLVRILVGQQLSTAAATTIYARLEAASGGVAPEFFLTNDDAALRALGLSNQKSRYIRALATAIASGALDLDGLAALPSLPRSAASASGRPVSICSLRSPARMSGRMAMSGCRRPIRASLACRNGQAPPSSPRSPSAGDRGAASPPGCSGTITIGRGCRSDA